MAVHALLFHVKDFKSGNFSLQISFLPNFCINALSLRLEEDGARGGHLSKELSKVILKSPPINISEFGNLDKQCVKRISNVSNKSSFSLFELYP